MHCTTDLRPVVLSTTKGHLRTGFINNPKEGFGLTSKNAAGDINVPNLMKTQLPILACPSDETVKELNVNHFQWPGFGVARTSYSGVLGDTWLGEEPLLGNDTAKYPSGTLDQPSVIDPSLRDCHRGTRCTGIFFRNTWLRPIKMATDHRRDQQDLHDWRRRAGLQSPFVGVLFERRLVLVQCAAQFPDESYGGRDPGKSTIGDRSSHSVVGIRAESIFAPATARFASFPKAATAPSFAAPARATEPRPYQNHPSV